MLADIWMNMKDPLTSGENLVTDKEASSVVVLLKLIHDTGESITLGHIPVRSILRSSERKLDSQR